MKPVNEVVSYGSETRIPGRLAIELVDKFETKELSCLAGLQDQHVKVGYGGGEKSEN